MSMHCLWLHAPQQLSLAEALLLGSHFSSVSCTGGTAPATPMEGLSGRSCPPGHVCPLGMVDPTSCPPGSYTPGTHTTKCYICPSGHYCVPGLRPQLCPRGECPANSPADNLSPLPSKAWPIHSNNKVVTPGFTEHFYFLGRSPAAEMPGLHAGHQPSAQSLPSVSFLPIPCLLSP